MSKEREFELNAEELDFVAGGTGDTMEMKELPSTGKVISKLKDETGINPTKLVLSTIEQGGDINAITPQMVKDYYAK